MFKSLIRGFALMAALMSAAIAHELTHSIGLAEVAMVRIAHEDGTPFAFVYYEIFPDGQDKPAQVGRTDVQGRVFFATDTARHWRLKAFAPDGHGVDLRFDAPQAVATFPVGSAATMPSRIERLLWGLAMIFGGFGIYWFWSRKKS